MKQVFILMFALLLFGCQTVEAPEEEPAEEVEAQPPAEEANRETVQLAVGGSDISIDYGRPQLQGRNMLAQLEDGQVWRLGMNEATTFETTQSLVFGNTALEAGKYSIWAKKVSNDEWHLIFNSAADIWGTQRDPENDVAEVPLAVGQLTESVERFTVELISTGGQSGEVLMKWATLEIKAPFGVK
jgi:hypothetical protein